MGKTFRAMVSDVGTFTDAAQLYAFLATITGQEVIITVETAEREKPKVQVCQAFFEHGNNCDKPAQWELWNEHTGAYSYCTEHVWRGFNPDEDTDYTVTPIMPIPPELPEPFMTEEEWDFTNSYHAVISVPEELRSKNFTVCFKEKITQNVETD